MREWLQPSKINSTGGLIYRERFLYLSVALFLALSLLSLSYAVITAPAQGKDLAMFQDMGRAWLDGRDQTAEGRFYGPPPFASVVFAPLAMLSTMQARLTFIAINLIATIAIILLIKKLWVRRGRGERICISRRCCYVGRRFE